MASHDLISDYYKTSKMGLSGSITRGLVVDVSDPLYSGRVRVWLPVFHGGSTNFVTADNSTVGNPNTDTYVDNISNLFDKRAVQCLPWAPVLGHNWASTSDLAEGTTKASYL